MARNDNVFQNETLNKVGRTSGWTRGNVEDTATISRVGFRVLTICGSNNAPTA
jgi:hypothetical protein